MFGKIIGVILLVLGIIFFAMELKNLIVAIKQSRQLKKQQKEKIEPMANEVNIDNKKGE